MPGVLPSHSGHCNRCINKEQLSCHQKPPAMIQTHFLILNSTNIESSVTSFLSATHYILHTTTHYILLHSITHKHQPNLALFPSIPRTKFSPFILFPTSPQDTRLMTTSPHHIIHNILTALLFLYTLHYSPFLSTSFPLHYYKISLHLLNSAEHTTCSTHNLPHSHTYHFFFRRIERREEAVMTQ